MISSSQVGGVIYAPGGLSTLLGCGTYCRRL